MKISDLLKNEILPFEIDDDKLRKLFSFFLHSAPTIGSTTSIMISEERLEHNWDNYISLFAKESYRFISSSCSIEKYLEQYHLENDSEVKRNTRGFVCKYRDTTEKDYTCLLRHIRNAIAHNHVSFLNAGNRKFVLFEDYNDNTKKCNSRILLSQTDLQRLKTKIIE